jgi:hypothetical protein
MIETNERIAMIQPESNFLKGIFASGYGRQTWAVMLVGIFVLVGGIFGATRCSSAAEMPSGSKAVADQVAQAFQKKDLDGFLSFFEYPQPGLTEPVNRDFAVSTWQETGVIKKTEFSKAVEGYQQKFSKKSYAFYYNVETEKLGKKVFRFTMWQGQAGWKLVGWGIFETTTAKTETPGKSRQGSGK